MNYSACKVASEWIILVPVVLKSAIDSVKGGLRMARKTLGKRKHDQLTSAVIAELLKEVPDVNAAEAKLKAAEATGVEPDMQLLRARSMLSNVQGFAGKKKSSPAMRAKWAKRTTKKRKRPQRRTKSRAKSSRTSKA